MIENLKKVIRLLSDGKFHFGAQLGAELNITRSAISKLVKQLPDIGVEIESVTGKGYRILGGLNLLSVRKIRRSLSEKNLEQVNKIEIFDQINSTNDYLMQKGSLSQKDIFVCLAEQQNAGKGRLGRKWVSPYGANIYLSVLFPFVKDVGDLGGLSLVVATIVADVLLGFGIHEHLGLKWPNDVLWQYRKLAGILIEISGEAHGINRAVIGIGLNVRMPKKSAREIDQPWIDLQEIIDHVPDRNEVVGQLINSLIEKLTLFQKEGFLPFLQCWKKLDVLVNKHVKIITPVRKMSGIARGVDKNGHFILEDHQGKCHIFSTGEISIKSIVCPRKI